MKKRYHLYVKSSCPFCNDAFKLLDKHQLQYTANIMDHNDELLTEVKERYDWKTIPIIFEISGLKGKQLIGGYTDLVNHLGEVSGD
jgi:glutaredoxin